MMSFQKTKFSARPNVHIRVLWNKCTPSAVFSQRIHWCCTLRFKSALCLSNLFLYKATLKVKYEFKSANLTNADQRYRFMVGTAATCPTMAFFCAVRGGEGGHIANFSPHWGSGSGIAKPMRIHIQIHNNDATTTSAFVSQAYFFHDRFDSHVI